MSGPSPAAEAAIQNFLNALNVSLTRITEHNIAMDAKLVEYAVGDHGDGDFQDFLEHRRQLTEMSHNTIRAVCEEVARVATFAIEKMKPH